MRGTTLLVLWETALNDLPVGPETPTEFKRALRDATRVGGFEKLYDLRAKTQLSRGTLSPAFSENQPMPTEATITAIVQAMHGDVEVWLARSRRVALPFPSDDFSAPAGTVEDTGSAAAASALDHEPPGVAEPPNAPDGDYRSSIGENSQVDTDPRHTGSQPRRGPSSRLVKGGVGAVAVVILALAGVVIWLLQRDNKAPEHTVVVQNEVAIGASDLVEDDSPSYLAARPIAKCANEPGCKLAGTDLHTFDTVQAVCQLQGALLTNANVESTGIKTNPNVAASTLWYGVRWSDGRRGYINEVYVMPSYRGGLGLPGC